VVAARDCEIDQLVQAFGHLNIARGIADPLEQGNRSPTPNPLMADDESERSVDGRNHHLSGCRWRRFRLGAGRPDSHRISHMIMTSMEAMVRGGARAEPR
jgi:hypothetical protein